MSEYKLITVSHEEEGLTATVTQRWTGKLGHIAWCITNNNGDIVHVSQTTGGAYKKKITKTIAVELMDDYFRLIME